MLRGMVFVDHMNFNIALNDYYTSIKQNSPNLDYNKIFPEIVHILPNIDYMKTTIFAPKPDDFLMNDTYLKKYYDWVHGMNNAKYIDVVEGRYIGRPISETEAMDIADKSTYYKVEKGTDINLAIHAITHAYNNSFDVAFVVSGDTDYISLYKQLKIMGKIVVVVAVKRQNLKTIIPEVDDYIVLDDTFFSKYIRTK